MQSLLRFSVDKLAVFIGFDSEDLKSGMRNKGK